MANKKITELTAATALSADDLLLLVDDPAGTPTSKKITFANAEASLGKVGKVTVTQPASGSTITIADGKTLTANLDATVSGTNTGDQTITLTGDVTGTGTGTFAATITSAAVTYAKIQNVSATDKILGRSSAGAGVIQEIDCTAAGRALIDDANAAAQVTTLGLAQSKIRCFGITLDGGGSALTTGQKGYVTIPFAGTITGWNITVDTGTCTFDIWKVGTGTAIPTDANSITSAAQPAIASGTAIHSTTLTNWTTAITANDIVGFNLDAVATATKISLVVEVTL